MKRRIVCIALSMILLIGLVPFPAHAESNMVTSDECVALLKEMEGFCAYPYWDVSQYSIGYGSGISNPDAERLMETGITEAEAEYLLRAYLSSFEGALNKFIDACGLNLTQNQFDALLLFTYNVGDGWTNLNGVGNFRDAIRNGATGNELLFRITQWCNAGGVVMDTLVERRLKEANMYLNGVYSNVMPQQYSYVRYNPCGGTTDAPVQGFEVGTGAVPLAEKWIHGKIGGEQHGISADAEEPPAAALRGMRGYPAPQHRRYPGGAGGRGVSLRSAAELCV